MTVKVIINELKRFKCSDHYDFVDAIKHFYSIHFFKKKLHIY